LLFLVLRLLDLDTQDKVAAAVVIPPEEAKLQPEEGTLSQYFLTRGGYPFLLGVLAKTGAKTWCFGGKFVVVCAVIVVATQPLIWARKIRHGFWIYF
jgi:hypothetical protein